MNERFLLVLWLTGRCNLRCRYCYAEGSPAGQDMSFETARQAIDRLQGYPLKIQFAGGEPLLNFPLAEQICAYVKEKNIPAVFQMQTNGTLLTEQIAARLKQLHISVGVSLDGIPEINNLTRGKSAEAAAGIRMLGEQGMMIGLNAVVTALNVEYLPKLADFAFYLGNVGGIGLDLLRYAGRGRENKQELTPSPVQLKNSVKQMYARTRELYRLSGRKIEIREVELARKRLTGTADSSKYCYASCGRSVVVLPDGQLYPCGSLIDQEYYMGRADAFRPDQILALESQTPDFCEVCRYTRYCPKGCPSRRIRNENTLDCVLLRTAFELAEGE